MSEKLYCYHCGTFHPKEEMRQVESKGRKRWRCIASILAARKGMAERDAFGRRVSAANKAEAQAILRARRSIDR
jgi:hypothetical protein